MSTVFVYRGGVHMAFLEVVKDFEELGSVYNL